jgi:FkbM family methyltransferase
MNLNSLLMTAAAWAARIFPGRVKKAFYANPTLARTIRQGLNRAVPPGFTETTIAGGDLAGYRLILDLQIEKDYWLGTYELELQGAVRDFTKPGSVVYDLGASIGYVSLLFAKAVTSSGRVLAFEPLPANLERLAKNISLNGSEDRVDVVPYAVIDATRPVEFLLGPSVGMGKAAGSSGRGEQVYEERLIVEGIALDDFVFIRGNPAPDIIKIDIEGGEILAFPGMRQILMKKHPIIFLELHGAEAAELSWQMLMEAGYKICRMKAGYPAVNSPSDLDWKAYLIALPQE